MTNKENRVCEMLGEVFPDVERVGMNRFMVWGSSQLGNRFYVELWFDDDFLEQENNDFAVYVARIACEAKEMLNDPNPGINKRGEILVSGNTRIEVHRAGDTFSITGAQRDDYG